MPAAKMRPDRMGQMRPHRARLNRAGCRLLLITAAMAALAAFAAPPLTPQASAALKEKIAAWQALTPSSRREARAEMQAWLQLPALQQASLRASAAAFAQLPAEQQAAMRVKFAALSGEEQHGWRLGPDLGPYYPRLHPLLAYVPEAQRLPLLRTLHAMSPQELELLGRLAFSTPPAERDALRQALILQPPADRLRWLMTEMDR